MHKLKPNRIQSCLHAFCLGAAMLFLAGCASLWQPAPEQLVVGACSFSPPHGWMRLSTPSYEMFSKDGPYLQYIFVQQRPLNQPFRHTRQVLNRTLLPNEAAEIVVDSLKSDPKIAGFELISSQPAILAGRPGFKLLYTHKDQQGVTVQSLYFGVAFEKSFLNLRYTAAQRYYFDKNFKEFEQMIKSLHLSS
jgi:hypothetical protein